MPSDLDVSAFCLCIIFFQKLFQFAPPPYVTELAPSLGLAFQQLIL